MSFAAKFNLISSAKLVILETFTPSSGLNSNLVTEGPTLTSVTFPADDYPFRGANSEGADINNHSVVVGWADNPADKKPVNYGVDRAQTGFIYTVADNSFRYLNDYICGRY